MNIVTFRTGPEHILMDFFKSFFSQAELFQGVSNPFLYTNNLDVNSLIINISDDWDQETVGATPSLVIQEGGFSENRRTLGGRHTWDANGNQEKYKSLFSFPYTIHCITEHKGSSKWLQAIIAKSLITFRWALYERGLDEISPINGLPPRRLSGTSVPGPYDCAIVFNCLMDDSWVLGRTGYEEQLVGTQMTATNCPIEYDENGDLIGDNFQQDILTDNSGV